MRNKLRGNISSLPPKISKFIKPSLLKSSQKVNIDEEKKSSIDININNTTGSARNDEKSSIITDEKLNL